MKRALSAVALLAMALLLICGLAAAIPGCAAADHLADQVIHATTPPAPGKAPTTAQAIVAGVEVAAAASGSPIGVAIDLGIGAAAAIAIAYQRIRSGKKIADRDKRLAAYREGFGKLAEAGVLTADLLDVLHPEEKAEIAAKSTPGIIVKTSVGDPGTFQPINYGWAERVPAVGAPLAADPAPTPQP